MQIVDVIMPCYNAASYVREAIESVLHQTSERFNLICIDDGSTDGTRDILEAYGRKITILEHPGRINKGHFASMNLALRNSQNKFVAFLDADDLWFPEKIELQMKNTVDDPDVDLVYTNGIRIDYYGQTIGLYLKENHVETNQPENLLAKSYIVPSCAFIKRGIINKIGYFKERNVCADHDFFLRVAENGNLAYINTPLFARRVHPGQISQNRKAREEGFTVLQEALSRYPYSKKAIRKRKAVLHYSLGEFDFHRGNFSRAMIQFMKAASLDFIRGFREYNKWYQSIVKKNP